MMKTIECKVEFLTPAFLGNAEQSGQWRTPPFKALLRQWWRVAVAKNLGYDFQKLRRREAQIFGHAWLEGDKDRNGKAVHARVSSLRMRLSRWTDGKDTKGSWVNNESHPSEKIRHPEVGPPIGPLLYLGYGPLETKREVVSGKNTYPTKLKANAAIQSGESAELSIAVPDEFFEEIEGAIHLMDAYGSIGGRSRNGWGSASFKPTSESSRKPKLPLRPQLDWKEALGRDWPHALGVDSTGALIWEFSQPFDTWKGALRELAKLKIGLRTQFKFSGGGPHATPEDRHWLSYPVTKHGVRDWKNQRLPNSLRFKLRPMAGSPDQLKAIVYHMPCLPPKDFNPQLETVRRVWMRIHQYLDNSDNLRRIPE